MPRPSPGFGILLIARRLGLSFGAAVFAYHTAAATGAGLQATGIAIGAAILGFFLPQVRFGARDGGNSNSDQ